MIVGRPAVSPVRIASTSAAAAALVGWVWLGLPSAPARAAATPADGSRAVVVELFTSEGCSSCPPADQFLAELDRAPVNGVAIIALSEHVDYWNRQGWVDPFSSALFTARQRAYSESLNADVYTPQMVVDGKWEFVGSDRGAAAGAIREASSAHKLQVMPSVQVSGGQARVHVDILPAGAIQIPSGRVLVGITEDGLSSNVTAGENQGHRLPHVAVARTLVGAGSTRRGVASDACDAIVPLDPSWVQDRLRVVVLVQAKPTGAIVGAASVPVQANGQTRLERR
jgi:hypothetical protein